jgi:hypothetical protein
VREAEQGGVFRVGSAEEELVVRVPPGARNGQTVRDPRYPHLSVQVRLEGVAPEATAMISDQQRLEGGWIDLITAEGPVSVRIPRGVADGQCVLLETEIGPVRVRFDVVQVRADAVESTGGGRVAESPPRAKSPVRRPVQWAVTAAVLAGLGGAVGIPATLKAREAAWRTNGLGNYRAMAQAALVYAADHDDRLPEANPLAALAAYTEVPDPLLTHNPQRSEMTWEWRAEPGEGLLSLAAPSETALLGESKPWPDGKRLAGFADGHAALVGLDAPPTKVDQSTLATPSP